jgi:hypothetical protein
MREPWVMRWFGTIAPMGLAMMWGKVRERTAESKVRFAVRKTRRKT